MKKKLASVLIWLFPCVLFIPGDEVLSLLALMILSFMVLAGIVMAREAM